jgi:hypothetical protein
MRIESLRVIVLVACFSAAALAACDDDSPALPVDTSGDPELVPFQEMARANGCADSTNRLFLIDSTLVYYDWSGACADAAFGRALFYVDAPLDSRARLCTNEDRISGAVNECQSAPHRALFDSILANRDHADLGLGSGHTVAPIPF